jgi:glutamate--cysteine ligase
VGPDYSERPRALSTERSLARGRDLRSIAAARGHHPRLPVAATGTMSAWLRRPAPADAAPCTDPTEELALSAPLSSDAPLEGFDDLLLPFQKAEKPSARFRVGTEEEKLGLLADTLAPVPFTGPRSVQRVLALLAERFGWQPEREHEQGEVISLLRDGASITLEPAGQLELSGAPFASVHETHAELELHLRELATISEELGLVWLSMGFHPFARQDELPQVPKLRYGIMQKYLPTRGPRALDMMRRTCTVQANMDYDSEHDAVRKLRIALALQPVTTAMFAHSPFVEGRRGDNLCERAQVWLGMDPDRSGILPFAWERDMSYRAYVEWALDVPMFMLKRGSRVIANTGQTFRAFLADGAEGERATHSDWETHLNTLFPEARLKKTIEVRGIDAQRTDLVCAVPALWKGMLYDERAMSELETLIGPLTAAQVTQARPLIARDALKAQLAGKPVLSWAQQVVEIASASLVRQASRDAAGRDESVYLTPLVALLSAGKTPAEALLEAVAGKPDFRAAVVAHARV